MHACVEVPIHSEVARYLALRCGLVAATDGLLQSRSATYKSHSGTVDPDFHWPVQLSCLRSKYVEQLVCSTLFGGNLRPVHIAATELN